MKSLLASLSTVLFAFFLVSPIFGQAITDPNYALDNIQSGNGVTTLKFLPTGDMLATEKRGKLLQLPRLPNGNFDVPYEILDLSSEISFQVESGLLGLAVDPDAASNRFLYLFYTTPTDQRLVRYTMDSSYSGLVGSSRLVLLQGLPRTAAHHKAGDIAFHPQDPDHLFITLGDDGDMNGSQDLSKYAGKMLRVRKTDGTGPADNPFYDNNPNSIPSRIWAYGFRNPYRITFVSGKPDLLFASENGGPNGQRTREDRVIRVAKGANCSWSQTAYNAGAASEWFTTPHPGCTYLAGLPPSVVGIAMAKGGTHGNLTDGSKTLLYWGTWSNGLYRYQFTNDDLDSLTPYPNASNIFSLQGSAMHLEFGPDGSLYGSEVGTEGAVGGWYQIQRYRYTGPAISVRKTETGNTKSKYKLAVYLGNGKNRAPGLYFTDVKGRSISGSGPDGVRVLQAARLGK